MGNIKGKSLQEIIEEAFINGKKFVVFDAQCFKKRPITDLIHLAIKAKHHNITMIVENSNVLEQEYIDEIIEEGIGGISGRKWVICR